MPRPEGFVEQDIDTTFCKQAAKDGAPLGVTYGAIHESGQAFSWFVDQVDGNPLLCEVAKLSLASDLLRKRDCWIQIMRLAEFAKELR